MRLSRLFMAIVLALLLAPSLHAQDSDFDVMLEDVELRPGVTADLHVRVFVNEAQPCDGRTVLIVPGAWESADPVWWSPFVEAFFTLNPAGRKGCRVAILDLPGHGLSGLPEGGPLFGELTMADYTTALIVALERLPAWGVEPKTILAHSMGGLVTALAQQALADEGSSLRKAFNIKNVLLLSPVPPAETPYWLADLQGFLFDVFYACYTGPGGGVYPGCAPLDVDSQGDVDYQDLQWFLPNRRWDCDPDTTPLGTPPLHLPAPVAEGLCDPFTPYGDTAFNIRFGAHESATAINEFLGILQYQRPTTERGLFGRGSGTTLWSIGLALDDVVLPAETAASHEHYAADPELSGYVLVEGPTADHLMIFFDPEGLLAGIAGKVDFP